MPNWCWNNLEVMCAEEHISELQDFVEKSTKATKEEFSFEGTHPMPEEIRETTTADKPCWYDWSCDNWGTKWDACESHVNESEPQYFSVGFETAWSPPIAWIQNIMDKYPNLEFSLEYDEPGMAYGGHLIAESFSGRFEDNHWETSSASECCEAKVFYEDDKEYTLDVGEYQCSKCKKDCETINMNVSEIKNYD
tara:strand:+ start:553 stop:1134 length:582 start_codon:yes stop_codon:yes gene_type:complete